MPDAGVSGAVWCPPRSLAEVVAAARAVDPAARLVAGAPDPADAAAVVVDGVELSSAAVRPGSLFAALPGGRHHGAEFAVQARAAGAVAVLSDRPDPVLPTVLVDDPRAVLGPVAAWLHGHPSQDLAVHGVTGTNGKTSTCALLVAGLRHAGRRAAWSTTLETVTPAGRADAGRTTAEAPAVQAHLAAARGAGATDAVLEVSSHGLALDRVAGTRFRTGVFTNLTPDHLDLHRDVESYFAAKASLFVPERCDTAVVVVDDEWGRRLARTTRCPTVTVSATGRPADWTVGEVTADASGTAFRLRGPQVDERVHLALLGAHQADNAAAAVAALVVSGLDPAAVVAGMADASVAGRLERVDAGQPFDAFVDFAHNVGGHDRVLPFLRSLTAGRLVVVAGVTGHRDVAKRAALGERIARHADLLVVTDESPHSEDPAALRAALATGARSASRSVQVVDEPDRGTALARAVAATGPGDVLVVVGRGADPVQVRDGRATSFDDRTELRRLLTACTPRPRTPSTRSATGRGAAAATRPPAPLPSVP